jgi:catechol 2,3-dioxygenase-like lactoylglutathione lyase family enzyme
MIRKIDCVMIPVGDLEEAAAFYARVFDLRPLWQDASSAGLGMPETDAEIVLHTMELPPELSVHYLVDDVNAAVVTYSERGCTVRTPRSTSAWDDVRCSRIRTEIRSACWI